MYSAKVVADSISPSGVRLTTLEVVMPRFVLAEFNTHRVFSRNSASSRAIPVEKRIKAVRQSPFVPEAFAANKKGMQAGENLSTWRNTTARWLWLASAYLACLVAWGLAKVGVHKQWANRIIEPYCWHTVVVTATEWDNFFALRLSKDAQPEIRVTAELMQLAILASTPTRLKLGEWHLPYIFDEDREQYSVTTTKGDKSLVWTELARISAARCARVSYLTHDGKRDTVADIKLAVRLQKSGHMSPFEHVAYATKSKGFEGNFRSWKQFRKLLPGEAVFKETV